MDEHQATRSSGGFVLGVKVRVTFIIFVPSKLLESIYKAILNVIYNVNIC